MESVINVIMTLIKKLNLCVIRQNNQGALHRSQGIHDQFIVYAWMYF